MTTLAEAPPRRHVPEDLFAMEDKSYEILDGCLVERQVSRYAAKTAVSAGKVLSLHLDENPIGELFDAEFVIAIFSDPNRTRRADLSFVRHGRLPEEDFGILRVPPDLVIEVMSLSNSGSAMREKVDEWLTNGVREVWVLYPNAREVYIYRSDARPRVLTADDVLETPDILPGFSAVAGTLFPKPLPVAVEAAQ